MTENMLWHIVLETLIHVGIVWGWIIVMVLFSVDVKNNTKLIFPVNDIVNLR
jgi:hypothetical protein